MLTFTGPEKILTTRQNRSFITFERHLYQEHLEEVAFLYEQRLGIMKKTSPPWPGLESVEDRIKAHMDALDFGGQTAIDMCLSMLEETDTGVLYAATRTFCRHNREDLLRHVLATLDPENDDRVTAVTIAFQDDLPESWWPLIEQMRLEPDSPGFRIAQSVISHRAERLHQTPTWSIDHDGK